MRYIYLLPLFFSIFIGFSSCDNMKYSPGRDTVYSFGNGRFQILRLHQEDRTLFDLETQSEVVHRVKDYSKEGEIVYALDEDGSYTILNFITGKFERYKTLKEAPNDHRKHFVKLNKN